MIKADLVVRHAGVLCTMVARPNDTLGRIKDGALAALDGRVVWTGPDADLERSVHLAGDLVDAEGRCVLPGLVDPHTHPVFAGSRAAEFHERLTGIPYAEQQADRRGIRWTVTQTRAASSETLFTLARGHADRFLSHGTTTIEGKTGYGLDAENEGKLLVVVNRLRNATSLRIIPTFLGAHVIPAGVEREAYVRQLVDEMLPAFRGQAQFCDAWCDPPAFTPTETRRILGRAKELGYGLRIHAAQIAPGEGPTIAAELGAASADHLEHATPAQAVAMARAGVVAVLCPIANFTVPGSPAPPVGEFRKAGLAMAIASDLNPGTSSSESVTLAMSLACIRWGMTAEEVILGATRHAARSLRLNGVAGCLTPGGYADAVVFDVEAPEEIPYHVGVNRAVVTIARGRVWIAP